MQFTKLTKENINLIKEYFPLSEISFCDISVGAKYMWRGEYVIDFCFKDNTLIMKEKGPDYSEVFYYPIGANVESALKSIENYCHEKAIPLTFCCIDDKVAECLKERYNQVQIFDEREWNDYIYTAEQFKTYAGKKLSGQRNHVNKFKRLYPDYRFKCIDKEDISRLNLFLDEYASSPFITESAKEEVELTRDYMTKIDELEQVGGFLEVDGKVVAMSIGEVVGDTLIVHVEKGLTNYSGVYPTIAQEFAKAFAGEGVEYINREEDCGEEGLRQSKTQYHPIEIKKKNCVIVKTLFDNMQRGIRLTSERLTIEELSKEDKQDYYRLYTDEQLNKWWGYDYHEDLGENIPSPDYFFEFQQKLKEQKEEFSFGVKTYHTGILIGELVLHNFDYFGGVEIGFRFFKEYQGKGFAIESASLLIEDLFNSMGAKKIKAKCIKENYSSNKLIERLGFDKISQDDKYYYFEKQKKAIS